MAIITPFHGVHYHPERVSLNEVIAPPYDVLSPEEQDALYNKNPFNIVRLILNKEEPQDNPASNRYSRAAAFLQTCLEQGILVADPQPSLYEYVQRFAHPLQPQNVYERRTLLVTLKLEPYENGVVLPHEETHSKAKEDRLNLMRATKANPEPIYGLYEDPDRALPCLLEGHRASQPLLSATVPSAEGLPEEHLVYAYTDTALLKAISAFFQPKRIWIADGHHRYETALNYQREQGGPSNPPKPHDFILIGLTAFEDPGLVVLPTHRMVRNVAPERLEELPLLLDRYFHVAPLSLAEAHSWLYSGQPEERKLVLVRPNRAYGLHLRAPMLPENLLETPHSPAWRRLDVSILQVLVLDRTLGISWQSLAHTADVAYTRDEEEAIRQVQSGAFSLACLLRPPKVFEIRDVAAAGDKMPQKSTYFYPKLYSGLLLRYFPNEENS